MQSRWINKTAVIAAVVSASAWLGLATGSAAAKGKKPPYQISLVSSLSGSGSTSALPGLYGVKAAVAYINSLGGVKGHKLHLNGPFDDQSSLSLAPAAGQQAVGVRPTVIMDTSGSADITPRLPVYDAAGLPLVAQGLSGQYFPWYYQIIPTPDQIAASTVTQAEYGLHVKTLTGKKIAYVVADSAGGRALAPQVKQQITAAGGTVVDTEFSPLGAATFTGAANVIASHPDEVLLADTNPDDILEAKTLKNAGFTGPMVGNFGGSATTTIQAIGGGYAAQWFALEVQPKTSLVYKWAKKTNQLTWAQYVQFPAFFAAMYYVAKGLGLCGYPCPTAKFEKSLRKLGPIDARGMVFGRFGVQGKNQSLIKNFELWTYNNGQFQNVNGKNAAPIPFPIPQYVTSG